MTLYRAATEDDRRFVIGTWASSYKNAHHAGMIASDDWPGIMHRQIEKLMARPHVRTIVAYEPPDFLYGFICGDVSKAVPVVHYVYVKGPYRSQEGTDGRRSGPRHARGLFVELGVEPGRTFLYTCRTSIVARLARDKICLARFVPAEARYTNHQEQHDRRNDDT